MYSIDGIGARIAFQRKQLKMTQEAFAETVGVSPQAVSKWETGIGCPDIALLPAICESLHITMEELFGRAAPPQKPEGFEFPPKEANLDLQGALDGVACYADAPGRQEGETVRFEDGSEADLRAGTVVNRGGSDIRLLFAQTLRRAADAVRSIGKEFSFETSARSGDLSAITSLTVKITGACDVDIRPSPTGAARWEARGSQAFLDGLSIADRDGTLYVETGRAPQTDALYADNTLTLYTPLRDMARLETAIHGSGDLSAGCNFEETDIAINGSGDVRLLDAGETRVRISGSGDLSARRLHNGLIEVRGSGDVAIGCASGDLYCRISGSGDVDVDGGDLGTLSLRIAGSGDFSAENVVCRQLNATLSGAGDAVIGRVKGESSEKVSPSSSLKVLRRG